LLTPDDLASTRSFDNCRLRAANIHADNIRPHHAKNLRMISVAARDYKPKRSAFSGGIACAVSESLGPVLEADCGCFYDV
jgi:hypothetical protein